ncbi:MAG TPA: hypothetical protein VME22_14385 [Solirubrobacteraceae bacterium]|nr:hypothetical protein [Solirubrobacteraceae bacterium]
MPDHKLRCSVCNQVIGFYEPIVALGNTGTRHTSLLNEPMLATEQVMHRHCAHRKDSGSPER